MCCACKKGWKGQSGIYRGSGRDIPRLGWNEVWTTTSTIEKSLRGNTWRGISPRYISGADHQKGGTEKGLKRGQQDDPVQNLHSGQEHVYRRARHDTAPSQPIHGQETYESHESREELDLRPVVMVLREGAQLGDAHQGHTPALHGDQGPQDPGLKVWQALAIQQSE
ncbi:hypothetical protein DFH08DRAFT_798934 [Mycena albidolilacea]|uniref:Uncharacterized protein n=1 Tax=Mycena albidolilacea TaxID=1033008 RepID=A0AAD7APS6_9AGAR|nr:hypothetical protein DFH08DRAFT_798934 [Mycena albidolilacea]